MATFKDILKDVAFELGELYSGIATGGSATTLVDSGLGGRDDDWKDGTLFIDYDAGAASAAPEGEFAEVTDYARTTGTITVAASALTAAPASGDEYSVAGPRWSLDTLKLCVNRGLNFIGEIPAIDTSLTTAAGTLEYTIPASARGQKKINDVYIGESTTSTDRGMKRRFGWFTLPDHKLIFTEQPTSGLPINILYTARHSRMRVYSDTLSPFVNPELAVMAGVYMCYRWAKRRIKGVATDWDQKVDDAYKDYLQAKKDWEKQKLLEGPPYKSILSADSDPMRDHSRRSKYGPFYPG